MAKKKTAGKKGARSRRTQAPKKTAKAKTAAKKSAPAKAPPKPAAPRGLPEITRGSLEGFYGFHNLPFSFARKEVSLSFEEKDSFLVYRRTSEKGDHEALLRAGDCKVVIQPVEPVNRPKALTPHLCIDFDKTLHLGPKETLAAYLTFPVEIGVFAVKGQEYEMLDILSFAREKFTLYGNPRDGVLCRHWQSSLSHEVPDVHPAVEGIMKLTVTSAVSQWTELTRAVFDAKDMKIFFNPDRVSLMATMKITGKTKAETGFQDTGVGAGMDKAKEMYSRSALRVGIADFVMMEGL